MFKMWRSDNNMTCPSCKKGFLWIENFPRKFREVGLTKTRVYEQGPYIQCSNVLCWRVDKGSITFGPWTQI